MAVSVGAGVAEVVFARIAVVIVLAARPSAASAEVVVAAVQPGKHCSKLRTDFEDMLSAFEEH